MTLRVAAQTCQPFPKAPRTALPIDLTTAERVGGDPVVEGPLTTVLLVPLSAGAAMSTAITGLDGSFALFSVPAGAGSFVTPR
ncbi:MAG: hypothetical protein ACQEXJ_21985 [Myxococcota bacterium]